MVKQPLDPLNIIGRVGRLYLNYASVLIPTTAVIFLVVGVLRILVRQLSLAVAGLVALPIQTMGTALVTGLAVVLVTTPQHKSIVELLHGIRPVLFPLIIVGLAAAVGEGVGLVLLIAPGLVLLTIWAVYAPVIVIERPGGFAALSRSRELVRGNGWRVFAVILVLVVAVAVIAGAFALIDHSAGTLVVLIVDVIISSIAVPLSALAAAVLYCDLSGATRDPSLPSLAT